MEPLRTLGGVLGATRTHDRGGGGGGKRDAEAFRRALEQEAGSATADGAGGKEAPMRTSLQSRPAPSRRVDDATPRHVDVIA